MAIFGETNESSSDRKLRTKKGEEKERQEKRVTVLNWVAKVAVSNWIIFFSLLPGYWAIHQWPENTMPKWRLVHIILGRHRWEDIARHDTIYMDQKPKPKKYAFQSESHIFVTTPSIFPQAYESMHPHTHTSKVSGESRFCLQYVQIIMVERHVCAFVYLCMYGQYNTVSIIGDDWKKATKCFGYCMRSRPKLLFPNDTRSCGWVRSESYRIICH